MKFLVFASVLLAACNTNTEPADPAAAPQAAAPPAMDPSTGLPPGHPALPGAEPAAPAATGMPAAHPGMDAAAAAAVEPVDKAEGEGAVTIAEAVSGAADLAGKEVLVRGKVVKFNPAIMGRNWVHLQDGSGSAADGSNDLTVTTAETVTKGDIVTLKGTLVTDQEFGAGYSYAVMVEEASLVE